MNAYAVRAQEKKSQLIIHETSKKNIGDTFPFQFIDNRPEAVIQQKLQVEADNYAVYQQQKENNLYQFKADQVIQLMFPAGGKKKVPMKNSLVSWGSSEYAASARDWREEEDLGGRNIATVSYTVNATGKTYETSEHSEGSHSEKLLFLFFLKNYGPDYKDKITFHWLYTERETCGCGSDYHDCSHKVPEWFDLDLKEEVFASVVYPDEAEMSGDEDERKEKAVRRRSRATNIIKRFQTRATAVGGGKASYDDPYPGGITRPMSPTHYPTGDQFKK